MALAMLWRVLGGNNVSCWELRRLVETVRLRVEAIFPNPALGHLARELWLWRRRAPDAAVRGRTRTPKIGGRIHAKISKNMFNSTSKQFVQNDSQWRFPRLSCVCSHPSLK